MDPATTCFQRRLFTVRAWCESHAWPSAAGLRHLIFHATSNGFDKVIRRAGRRVLIDEAEFYAWLDRQQASSGAAAQVPGEIVKRQQRGRQ